MLKDFLNSSLPVEEKIVDFCFKNKEKLGDIAVSRNAVNRVRM